MDGTWPAACPSLASCRVRPVDRISGPDRSAVSERAPITGPTSSFIRAGCIRGRGGQLAGGLSCPGLGGGEDRGGGRRGRAAATALRVLGTAQVVSSAAYLLVRGAPSAAEAAVLALGDLYPFLCAALCLRPGGYTLGTRLAAGLAVTVTTGLCLLTGGLGSPFLPILVTVPSADFSVGGQRGVWALGALALAACGVLIGFEALGWVRHLALPDSVRATATAIFVIHCIVVMLAVNLGVALARTRATRELAAARDAAEAASRAKSSFLAMMSHEVRTPLTGIRGTLDLLAETQDAQSRELVEVARSSAAALRRLLDDILEFSKLEAGGVAIARTTCSPGALLREVAALFATEAKGRGLALATEVDASCDPPASLDALRLRQVVSNLISNALKFTREGGVTLRAAARGGRLEVSVEDTGIGIPAARLGELFQPFVQVHAPGRGESGTGLGLVICRRVVEAMGGTIDVKSSAGAGSTFSFVVPLAAAAAAGVDAGARSAPRPAQVEALRVLVAEDTPGIRRVLEAILRRRGHSVALAGDGRDAIARASAEDFDLVLMDMQMPECDGLAATRAIRALGSPRGEVRIVALSADAFAERQAEARAAGCDDYLTKPIDFEALAAVLAATPRRASSSAAG